MNAAMGFICIVSGLALSWCAAVDVENIPKQSPETHAATWKAGIFCAILALAMLGAGVALMVWR